MFKSIRNWYISQKEEKAKREQEERDWEECKESIKIVVPEELLKKFIDANPEYFKDRVTKIYFPNGQFWYNMTYSGNMIGMLEDNIKRLIHGNLKIGVPYDRIIAQLSDPNFKMQEEPESKEDK